MRLALGVLFLWMGATALYLASHGLDAASPWTAFATVLKRIRESGGADAAAS